MMPWIVLFLMLLATAVIDIMSWEISGTTAYAETFTLTWDDVSGVSGYKVYYKTNTGSTSRQPPYDGTGIDQGDSPIDVGGVTEFVVSGVPHTAYPGVVFVVTAYNDWESDYSDSLTIFDEFMPILQSYGISPGAGVTMVIGGGPYNATIGDYVIVPEK